MLQIPVTNITSEIVLDKMLLLTRISLTSNSVTTHLSDLIYSIRNAYINFCVIFIWTYRFFT